VRGRGQVPRLWRASKTYVRPSTLMTRSPASLWGNSTNHNRDRGEIAPRTRITLAQIPTRIVEAKRSGCAGGYDCLRINIRGAAWTTKFLRFVGCGGSGGHSDFHALRVRVFSHPHSRTTLVKPPEPPRTSPESHRRWSYADTGPINFHFEPCESLCVTC
jgi:hypothetical protein